MAACYQLAQSILKIGFTLAKKVGKGGMGGFQHGVPCTWHLPWLAIRKPWSALAGPFLSFLTQTGIERLLHLCKNSISATADSFQLGEAFTGWRALTICYLQHETCRLSLKWRVCVCVCGRRYHSEYIWHLQTLSASVARG